MGYVHILCFAQRNFLESREVGGMKSLGGRLSQKNKFSEGCFLCNIFSHFSPKDCHFCIYMHGKMYISQRIYKNRPRAGRKAEKFLLYTRAEGMPEGCRKERRHAGRILHEDSTTDGSTGTADSTTGSAAKASAVSWKGMRRQRYSAAQTADRRQHAKTDAQIIRIHMEGSASLFHCLPRYRLPDRRADHAGRLLQDHCAGLPEGTRRAALALFRDRSRPPAPQPNSNLNPHA